MYFLTLFIDTVETYYLGTSSDPSQEKCGSPLIKVTLTKLSISNLRHAFTLN